MKIFEDILTPDLNNRQIGNTDLLTNQLIQYKNTFPKNSKNYLIPFSEMSQTQKNIIGFIYQIISNECIDSITKIYNRYKGSFYKDLNITPEDIFQDIMGTRINSRNTESLGLNKLIDRFFKNCKNNIDGEYFLKFIKLSCTNYTKNVLDVILRKKDSPRKLNLIQKPQSQEYGYNNAFNDNDNKTINKLNFLLNSGKLTKLDRKIVLVFRDIIQQGYSKETLEKISRQLEILEKNPSALISQKLSKFIRDEIVERLRNDYEFNLSQNQITSYTNRIAKNNSNNINAINNYVAENKNNNIYNKNNKNMKKIIINENILVRLVLESVNEVLNNGNLATQNNNSVFSGNRNIGDWLDSVKQLLQTYGDVDQETLDNDQNFRYKLLNSLEFAKFYNYIIGAGKKYFVPNVTIGFGKTIKARSKNDDINTNIDTSKNDTLGSDNINYISNETEGGPEGGNTDNEKENFKTRFKLDADKLSKNLSDDVILSFFSGFPSRDIKNKTQRDIDREDRNNQRRMFGGNMNFIESEPEEKTRKNDSILRKEILIELCGDKNDADVIRSLCKFIRVYAQHYLDNRYIELSLANSGDEDSFEEFNGDVNRRDSSEKTSELMHKFNNIKVEGRKDNIERRNFFYNFLKDFFNGGKNVTYREQRLIDLMNKGIIFNNTRMIRLRQDDGYKDDTITVPGIIELLEDPQYASDEKFDDLFTIKTNTQEDKGSLLLRALVAIMLHRLGYELTPGLINNMMKDTVKNIFKGEFPNKK